MTTRTDDPALDDALDRISDLASRLWAVRQAHRPVVVVVGRPGLGRALGRAVLGGAGLGGRRAVRCAGCGQASPCPTLRAAG